jgi:hypothetical protein
MNEIRIAPMPRAYLEIPPRLRPMPPPIFTNGDPSADDEILARELFRALDPESQAWYRSGMPRLFGDL